MQTVQVAEAVAVPSATPAELAASAAVTFNRSRAGSAANSISVSASVNGALSARNHLSGRATRRAVASARAGVSIGAHPSFRDIEGFGLTPLEAWRYGRVPIISSGCGAAEIVTTDLTPDYVRFNGERS